MSFKVHKISGFSLVELLIVIAVISVLAGLTLAGIGAVSTQAKQATLAQTLSDIEKATLFYKNTYSSLPPFEAVDDPGGPYKDFTETEMRMLKDSFIALYLCGGEIVENDNKLELIGLGMIWDQRRQESKPAPLNFTADDFFLYGNPNDTTPPKKWFALLKDPWFENYSPPSGYDEDTAPKAVWHYNNNSDDWLYPDEHDTSPVIQKKLPELPFYIYSEGDPGIYEPENYSPLFNALNDEDQSIHRTNNSIGNWRKQR